MKLKQQIRAHFLNFLKHYFNPLTRRIARSSFGPFAIVRHVGRRSGKQYETPIIVGPAEGGFVFELTYGPDVDWYKNVLAAGGCTIIWHGKSYVLDKIEPLDTETGRAAFPLLAQLILRAARRQHFVKMRIEATTELPSNVHQAHDRSGGSNIMTVRSTRVPSWVPFFNRIARPLIAAGVPMGPNVLITVRGRKSGLPRTTPVTLIENAGRRGLIAPFGEVNWVRNLRAAEGRATITAGRRKEEVTAVELGYTEAVEFIRDVLAPEARRMPLGGWIVRNIDKIDYDHPEEAARGRPVFELQPLRPKES